MTEIWAQARQQRTICGAQARLCGALSLHCDVHDRMRTLHMEQRLLCVLSQHLGKVRAVQIQQAHAAAVLGGACCIIVCYGMYCGMHSNAMPTNLSVEA